jgi:hypothetical protein
MAKFAKGEEKLFDPISNKVLSAIASPIGSLPEEEPSPALVKPAEDLERPPEPPPARTRATPERLRVVGGKRPASKRRVPVTAKSERLSKAVKCLFTPSEEQELRALVGCLATEVKFSLTLSHLMRPYFELLLHCEEQLTNEIRRAGLTRPINEKTAIALFENVMAEAIHAALRKTSQFRAERREGDDQ